MILDADLYTKSDFDEQIVQDTAHANLSLSYDLNESFRLALSNRLTYVRDDRYELLSGKGF